MNRWKDIPEEEKEILIEWFNRQYLNERDKPILARLYHSGNFAHWNCPECGTQIMVGQPQYWSHFQGALQSEHVGQLCEDCGAHYLHLKQYAGE